MLIILPHFTMVQYLERVIRATLMLLSFAARAARNIAAFQS